MRYHVVQLASEDYPSPFTNYKDPQETAWMVTTLPTWRERHLRKEVPETYIVKVSQAAREARLFPTGLMAPDVIRRAIEKNQSPEFRYFLGPGTETEP